MRSNISGSIAVFSARAELVVMTIASIVAGLIACANEDTSPDGCPPVDSGLCDPPPPPRISLLPDDAIIRIVDVSMALGHRTQQMVRVINVSESPLKLERVELDYSPPAGADDHGIPAFAMVMAPVEPVVIHSYGGTRLPQAADIVIEYTKRHDDFARAARLVLSSNDPFTPIREVTFTTATAILQAAQPDHGGH